MKKASISVQMDDEKFKATQFYAEKNKADIAKEMEDALVRLYEKYVPQATRDYIDFMCQPAKQKARPAKPKAGQPTQNSQGGPPEQPAASTPPLREVNSNEHRPG